MLQKDNLILKKKTLSLLLRKEYLQPKHNKAKIIQLESELNEINKKLAEKEEG